MNLRLLPLFAAVTSAVVAQPRPLAGNPGNVFVKGQEVIVKAAAAVTGKWICVDYDGKLVAEGTGPEAKPGRVGTGYYEVWHLADDGSRKTRTTFAMLEPLKVPVPDDTPIALDTAAAWFFRDGKKPFGLKEAANLSALAGVKWTRDRLSWNETEPERGKFTGESIYDESAEAFAGEGLKVLQVFHDTPPWAGSRPKYFPDDLRDVHAYLKTMSARWKGKVHAWEPWNEGDTTHFGGHTGAEMMAYQRAAYHGIRAGNPDAIVCQNVFAEHRKTGVLENFIENIANGEPGVSRLPFDTFNFHHYIQPRNIPGSYEEMKTAANALPIWVTESYFHFRQGVRESDLELSEEQRKERARFVTTNLVTALNEQPARFFTFVLPHYVENGVLFGLLNADGSPRADYVALAAAGRLLAGAHATGNLRGESAAYTFSAKPDGIHKRVVVLWSQEPKPLPPSLSEFEKAYDFLGREVSPESIGIDPVYLVFPMEAKIDAEPPTTLRPPDREPPGPFVVQAVFPHERLRLASSSWQVKQGETLAVPMRFYHFGANEEKVSVIVEAEPALKVSLRTGPFVIPPGGRIDTAMDIGWSGRKVPARPLRIKVTAKADGQADCTAVFRISTGMGAVEPALKKPLAATKAGAIWKPGSSKGKLDLKVTEGVVEVSAFLGEGDRWVYPWHPVDETQKPMTGAEGIAFTLTPRKGDAVYHVMFREPGGVMYSASLGELTADGKPQRIVVTFDEFRWANYSPEDGNHQLDPGLIEAVTIGGNPKEAELSYELGDIDWVKFAD